MYIDMFWTNFIDRMHLRIQILSRCFAIIQKVMFAVFGKLTTRSAVTQIQLICYVTSPNVVTSV